ncbi:MAG: 50S ribosomal protein L19 [Candidatus Omnitrophica bacterium]|nr:50S ribosomal protein L19 [Candidatus Omnitrophota bacterium]
MVASAVEQLKTVEQKFFRKDLPVISVGDFIKMKVKVKEAEKVRIHPFEGTIIKITGRGARATFTVRKISFGEGVERVFPIHSPVIESLQIVSKGIVKRARLYYLRDRVGKKARLRKDMHQEATPSVAAV